MKYFVVLVLFTVLTATSYLHAQPPQSRPPASPPRHPILDLFDEDEDGELSMDELNKATEVMKRFDRNEDNIVSRDELPRPPRPNGEPKDRSNGEGSRPDKEGRPRVNSRRDETLSRESRSPIGTVHFRDGYDTDRRDRGRPVVLIAAALGVSSEVFREAFSGVTPARGSAPTGAQLHANKEVLLKALSGYGVTNERLDEVSDYYRYRPQEGELWKNIPAEATAVIENGTVRELKITHPGAGYSTQPRIEISGYPDVKVEATLLFTKDLKTNGSIKSLVIVEK